MVKKIDEDLNLTPENSIFLENTQAISMLSNIEIKKIYSKEDTDKLKDDAIYLFRTQYVARNPEIINHE